MSKAFTSSELADLKTSKNLHLVIHGKGSAATSTEAFGVLTADLRYPVYAIAPFIDEVSNTRRMGAMPSI